MLRGVGMLVVEVALCSLIPFLTPYLYSFILFENSGKSVADGDLYPKRISLGRCWWRSEKLLG